MIVYSVHAAASFTLDKDTETLSLEFPTTLTSSCGPIHIEYTGTLNDQMRGFYRSKYTCSDKPSEERYGAVTQFEVRIVWLTVIYKQWTKFVALN